MEVEKTREVYNGKLLKVEERRQVLPNGKNVVLEVVRHPGAVLIVPFLTADSVIMLKQYRAVIDSYIYELPAGTLDAGEKPAVCARRELIEETGYRCRRLKKMGVIYPAPGYTTEKIALFRADQLTPQERMPEEDEIIETHVFTRQKVRQLLRSGKIVDAKTICALALFGWT